MKLSKKYRVKIPKNIKIIYIEKKDIITFIGLVGRKSLKLKLKIFVNKSEKVLYIENPTKSLFSGSQKKKFNSLQGTTVALLKQCILEVSVTLHKKLELVGVGYRVFLVEGFSTSILQFKLGLSHQIFFKLTAETTVLCLKSTNLYIFGNSFGNLTQLAATIRSYKLPEPYKGKGILYKNEKINIKEGKKV